MAITYTITSALALKRELEQNFEAVHKLIYTNENTNKIYIFYLNTINDYKIKDHRNKIIKISFHCATLLAGPAIIDKKKIILICDRNFRIPINSNSLIVIKL